MKISATRSPNVASNLWSILYSHAVRFFLPLPTATCSLSLSLSLYTSPSRSLTRSFALSFSLSRALALINDQFLSLAPPRLYIALSLHHTSENPVSKRENGWTTCTRFKTNTTNLRVTLAGRYYVLFQLPFSHPSSIRGTFRSLAKTTNSPSCGTVIPHPKELFILYVKRIDKWTFYCREFSITHYYFCIISL